MRQPILLRPEPATQARPGRELRLGGLTPFTTIDFPGRLSAVFFVQGCPWRCGYCHNPHLQPRATPPALAWPNARAWHRRRTGLLDGVVFSGGEPTADPALGSAVADVRALGFAVGLHSADMYPQRLRAVLPLIDWAGLDVKAPLDDPALYDRVTGRSGSAAKVAACVEAIAASSLAHEIRTTIHPDWLDDASLLRLGRDLASRGVRHLVLQIARPAHREMAAVPPGYPAPGTLDSLRPLFERLDIRRD